MLSIGGVIGAGYFLGAGAAIKMAGPAVILSYLLGGVIAISVMLLLAEMSVAMPVAGAFQHYAKLAINPWAGFITGWTYWLAFLIGPASEAIAAATFLNLWFPGVPVWLFCLIIAILITVINLIGVHFFGEVEFWLSLIKVIALSLFIIIGLIVLGFHTSSNVSIINYTGHGGFMPHGFSGVMAAMLIVFLSYGGTEAIATAAEESENPVRDIPVALKSSVVRIILIYIISITVLIGVLPWNKAGISSSPYVDAFMILCGPTAGHLMNFVVLVAALSCIDAGIYATSRMLFSLAREGYFPKQLTQLNSKSKSPTLAILCSSLVLLLAVICAIITPRAYTILASLSGLGFLFTWLMIALSQPGIRRVIERSTPEKLLYKAPFNPYLQKFTVFLLIIILIGQIFVDGGITLLAGGCWLLFASMYYYWCKK